MDIEQLKAVLNRARVARHEIAGTLEVMQSLRSKAEGTQTRGFSLTSHSHGHSELTPSEQLLSMQEVISKQYSKMLDYMAYTLYLIYLLEPSPARCILLLRYISNKEWDKIAEKLCYSWEHIHRLHRKALNELLELQNTDKALDFNQWKAVQRSSRSSQDAVQLFSVAINKADAVLKELKKLQAV